MENFFGLLMTVSLILLIIGFVKPTASLFWYKKERSKKNSAMIYGILFLVSLCIFGSVAEAPTTAVAGIADEGKYTKAQLDSIKLVNQVADSMKQVEVKAEERKKEIEKQFSAWDGSHRNLEKFIKANMNDPESYDHIETKYWDMGEHLVVMMKFRGANAFGGKVVNTVKAQVDMDGNVIKIIETL